MRATEKTKINASLSNVTMSAETHKMIITGCITQIGKASTGAPCGAQGKRVVFTPESIEACAQSFVGMPLNCTYPDGWWGEGTDLFTDHGRTNIGYIREVHAEGENLMAELVVWKEKFPDEAYMILNGVDALGFSVEWYATKTHENEELVYMDEFEGCGCAILWQNCAAFGDTFIERLAAARDKNRSDVEMTKEEMQELMKEFQAGVEKTLAEKLETIEKAQDEIKAALDSKASTEDVEGIKEQVEAAKEAAEKAKGEVEAMQAAAEKSAEEDGKDEPAEPTKAAAEDIPAPKAGQGIAPNPNVGEGDKEAEIGKINASAMNPLEKIREITKLRMKG